MKSSLLSKRGMYLYPGPGMLVVLVQVLVLLTTPSLSERVPYASETTCERRSLHAVYHEKIAPATGAAFDESIRFVARVCDLIEESLTNIMSEVDYRRASDERERRVHQHWEGIRKRFSSRAEKLHQNTTAAWEGLLAAHSDLMLDNGRCTLARYLGGVRNVSDAYLWARRSLDSNLELFVRIVRNMVRDGLEGITAAAHKAVKEEEEKRKKGEETDEGEEEAGKNESPEERVSRKRLEIAELIAEGFLGNLTLGAARSKMDLFRKTDVDPEDRESVLQDLLYDVLMAQSRVLAVVQPDRRDDDKGSVDLARRSIYTYWYGLADAMYRTRLREEKTPREGIAEDKDSLVQTVLDLMEVYS